VGDEIGYPAGHTFSLQASPGSSVVTVELTNFSGTR